MTFQEANKNSKELFCRNHLSYDATIKRLEKYFSKNEVFELMIDVIAGTSWTDGNIVVICTDLVRREFSIVAPGIYMELIEP